MLHVLTSLFFQEVAVVSTGKAHESQKQVHAPLDADVSRTAALDDATLGYRGPAACRAAGVTYRQLDYWARTGLLEPSVRNVSGSGHQRLYSFRDVLVLKVIKRLLDAGVSLQQIRVAVAALRDHGVKELAGITLMSDGASVYECTSDDQVIDLLRGGQGVFGIALGSVWAEVEGTLAELPGERPDATEIAVHPGDELRKRRAAKRAG